MTSAVRNTTIPTLAPLTTLPKKMYQQAQELARRILQEPSLKAYEDLARHNIWDKCAQVEVCKKSFSKAMCCSYVLEHLSQDTSFPFDLLLHKLERVRTIDEKVVIRGQETSIGDCIAQLLPWQPPAADKQKAARSWQILGKLIGSHQSIQTSSSQTISASACFVKAIELNPKDKTSWLFLIDSMSSAQTVTIYGRSFSYLDCCSKAIQLDPNEWQVWLLIGELLDQTQTITLLGREYHATECIAHVLRESPTDDTILSLQAWLLLGKVLSKTMAVFDATGIRNGGSKMTALDVHRKLLPYLNKMTQFQQSEYWCRTSELLSETAYIEYKGKKFYKIDCIVQGLTLQPKEAAAWMALGQALIRSNVTSHELHGSTHTPQSCIMKGLESYSGNPIPGPELIYLYTLLARTMSPTDTIILKKQKFTKHDLLLKILGSQLASATQWYECGVAMDQTQVTFQDTLYTQAVCFQKAALLAPEHAIYWSELGAVLIKQDGTIEIDGIRRSGPECIQRALELDGTMAPVWSNLGWFLLGHNTTIAIQNKEMDAGQCFLQAIQMDEHEYRGWEGLAHYLHRGGSLQHQGARWQTLTALDCYSHALKHGCSKNSEHLWADIGSALGETEAISFQGKKFGAIDCYFKALEANPKNALLWKKAGFFLSDHPTLKKAFSWQSCLANSLTHGETDIAIWERLAEKMTPLDTITVARQRYNRIDCTQRLLEHNPSSMIGWYTLATQMHPKQSITIQGESYNRNQCSLKLLHMQCAKDWIALGKKLRSSDTLTLGTQNYTRDDCYFKATQYNPTPEDWVAIGEELVTDYRRLGKHGTLSAFDCFMEAVVNNLDYKPAWELFNKIQKTMPK